MDVASRRVSGKAALLAVLLLGCVVAFGSFLSESVNAADEPVIRFGVFLPLTGPLSTEGEKHIQGYRLWADLVNERGGINVGGVMHKVELVEYDYRGETATAVRLAERLITEDRVNLMFGPFGSGHAKATSAITERYGVPMIAPSASSEEVYTDGFKYIFGTFTPNHTLTEPLADIASRLPEPPKTMAIIARNDLFPLAIAQEARKSWESRNGQVVMFQEYPIGTTDFSAVLNQVRSLQPDWLFATGYAQDLILIASQMRELNVNVKMLTMIAGAAYKEFIDALGSGAEYVTTATWWHPAVTYEGEDIFGTAENYSRIFQERYGYIPDYPIASASAVGVIFQAAIERAGTTDPKAVRDALAELDIMTFFGPIRFNERGQNIALDPPVLQIMNGQHVPIHPDPIKQMELQYPMPSWRDR